jgi:hypothetical protein
MKPTFLEAKERILQNTGVMRSDEMLLEVERPVLSFYSHSWVAYTRGRLDGCYLVSFVECMKLGSLTMSWLSGKGRENSKAIAE